VTYGVLHNRLAYPERDYTQWLTAWKKNGRRGSREGARSKPVLTTVFTRWRSLKPCARQGERSILREAPQGRSGKMWSESTLRTQCPRRRRPGPNVAPPAGAGYREKTGPGAILFPSSRRSRPARCRGPNRSLGSMSSTLTAVIARS